MTALAANLLIVAGAILWNANNNDPVFRETQRVAPTLSIQLQLLEVREQGDFDGAFQTATRERAAASPESIFADLRV
jgi:hypothetical protein